MLDTIKKRGIIDPYDMSDNPDRWVVIKPYVFYSKRLDRDIIISKWFVTDLASIPKPLRSLFSVNDRHRLAALLHDWLYASRSVSRKEADLVFMDMCEMMGVSLWKRKAMYYGVRAGGWASYGKRSKDDMFIPKAHKDWYHRVFPEVIKKD